MFHPEMPYRSLGGSGLKVSLFSLGGWTTFGGSVTDFETIRSIHRLAYEAGINFYDNADIYSKGESEKLVGEALKDFPRHELVISSKTFWPMSEDVNDKGLSRKHIMESVNKSLKRLGTDYLDLYFCHRYDQDTPLEETIRAMDDLIRQGKILYWGTSEWSGSQIQAAHEICTSGGYYKPQVEQPQYNLLTRDKFEKDVAPTAAKLKMGLVTWSPLASGALTGKYDEGVSDGRLSRIDWLRETYLSPENQKRILEFKELAESNDVTRTELALAWVASHPHVSSVILGASTPEQLEHNLRARKLAINETLAKKLKQIFS